MLTKNTPLLIILLFSSLSFGCAGSRQITFDSNPTGASLEMVAPETSVHDGLSTTQAQYTYNPITNTTQYTPSTYSIGQGSTTRYVRKINGYTPASYQWIDGNDPAKYVKYIKGNDWVCVYVEIGAPLVFVDFGSIPMRVRGARIADSNRPAVRE